MGALNRRILGGPQAFRTWRLVKLAGSYMQLSEFTMHELMSPGVYGSDLISGLSMASDGTDQNSSFVLAQVNDGNTGTGMSLIGATYIQFTFPVPRFPQKLSHCRQSNLSYSWSGEIRYLAPNGAWVAVATIVSNAGQSGWLNITW